MHFIITNNHIIKYAFPDTSVIVSGKRQTTVVDEDGVPVLRIADLNSTNSYVTEGELPIGETIESFVGDEYMLVNGTDIVPNPDYVPPPQPEQPE